MNLMKGVLEIGLWNVIAIILTILIAMAIIMGVGWIFDIGLGMGD